MRGDSRIVVAVVGVVLALAGCGLQGPTEPTRGAPDPGPPTTVEDTGTTSGPEPEALATLEVSMRVAPATSTAYSPDQEGLAVSYTVTNDGTAPLLVVTERGHAQASSTTAPAVPESVWVSAASENGAARLSKQVFDVPSGVLPTAPWRAPAVLVPPGDSVEGQMFALLPLRGDLPPVGETLTHEERPLSVDATSVELCVQVAPSPGPDAYNDEITMSFPGRTLVCSDVLPLPTD